mmetsp:Transcript_37478/g.94710  ORF Transcript_37478/g.94710 Transcript_37478/m.94710 type:complete len:311 (+) Transcript_37478:104-1036(+)
MIPKRMRIVHVDFASPGVVSLASAVVSTAGSHSSTAVIAADVPSPPNLQDRCEACTHRNSDASQLSVCDVGNSGEEAGVEKPDSTLCSCSAPRTRNSARPSSTSPASCAASTSRTFAAPVASVTRTVGRNGTADAGALSRRAASPSWQHWPSSRSTRPPQMGATSFRPTWSHSAESKHISERSETAPTNTPATPRSAASSASSARSSLRSPLSRSKVRFGAAVRYTGSPDAAATADAATVAMPPSRSMTAHARGTRRSWAVRSANVPPVPESRMAKVLCPAPGWSMTVPTRVTFVGAMPPYSLGCSRLSV